MNLRLQVLLVLALLVILPGVFCVIGGVLLGFMNGGWLWIFSAWMVGVGIWLVWLPIRFLRKPTTAVASKMLGVVSFWIGGFIGEALRYAAPDVWGFGPSLESRRVDVLLVPFFLSILVGWIAFRALKRFFVGAVVAENPATEKL